MPLYLNTVASHVGPFMTTVCPSDGCFQQDDTPCRKAQITSDWCLENENVICTLQSPDLINRAGLGCGETGD